jgi:hypothetical protein
VDPRAYEKQGARLIGLTLGGALILIMTLYSISFSDNESGTNPDRRKITLESPDRMADRLPFPR